MVGLERGQHTAAQFRARQLQLTFWSAGQPFSLHRLESNFDAFPVEGGAFLFENSDLFGEKRKCLLLWNFYHAMGEEYEMSDMFMITSSLSMFICDIRTKEWLYCQGEVHNVKSSLQLNSEITALSTF